MPNWCNNTLELAHEDPAMIARAQTAFKAGALLAEFIPVPESLRIVAGRVGEDTDPKQIELVAQEQANREAYGYANWYDYCVGEWGTKWDVGGDDYDVGLKQDSANKIIMSFDSAWAPPCVAYEKLVALGFSVRAYYYESGMCFAGVWEDGIDDFYEYGGMDSAQVADELPTALNEMFCISEQMAEWEEENNEEEDEKQ